MARSHSSPNASLGIDKTHPLVASKRGVSHAERIMNHGTTSMIQGAADSALKIGLPVKDMSRGRTLASQVRQELSSVGHKKLPKAPKGVGGC